MIPDGASRGGAASAKEVALFKDYYCDWSDIFYATNSYIVPNHSGENNTNEDKDETQSKYQIPVMKIHG